MKRYRCCHCFSHADTRVLDRSWSDGVLDEAHQASLSVDGRLCIGAINRETANLLLQPDVSHTRVEYGVLVLHAERLCSRSAALRGEERSHDLSSRVV